MRLAIYFSFFAFLSRTAPGLDLPKHPFPVHGQFSAGCFLLNGYWPRGAGSSFVYLVNNQGRVTWHYIPSGSHSEDARTRVVLAKPLRGGRIGLLRPYNRSRLEILRPHSSPLILEPSLPVHHDFLERADGKILTFGQSLVKLRRPGRFDHSPDPYLGSPLVEINPLTQRLATLWDYLTPRTPFLDSDWTATALDHGTFWVDAQTPPAAFNFAHANSLEPAGTNRVLLSLRSLNKLVLVDFKTRQTIFTVGPSRRNTFSTGGSEAEFYRQHHATYLPDGGLLVFDNGRTQSRVLRLNLNSLSHQTQVKQIYQPSPPIFSQRHGSAELLPNGNILAFFPHNSDQGPDLNHLIEFDGQSGKTVARMDIDWGANASAYRASAYLERCRFP